MRMSIAENNSKNKKKKINPPIQVTAIEFERAAAARIEIKYKIQNNIAFLAFLPAGFNGANASPPLL